MYRLHKKRINQGIPRIRLREWRRWIVDSKPAEIRANIVVGRFRPRNPVWDARDVEPADVDNIGNSPNLKAGGTVCFVIVGGIHRGCRRNEELLASELPTFKIMARNESDQNAIQISETKI
jgi:hypothetical protein